MNSPTVAESRTNRLSTYLYPCLRSLLKDVIFFSPMLVMLIVAPTCIKLDLTTTLIWFLMAWFSGYESAWTNATAHYGQEPQTKKTPKEVLVVLWLMLIIIVIMSIPFLFRGLWTSGN